MNSFIEVVGDEGLGTNLLPLVTHGALRVSVMGSGQEKPTNAEMKEMVSLLRENLDQGAWGLSTGLAYAPGSFAEFEEILELCKEIKRQNSYYTSHIRNESDGVFDSIDEVIEIGKFESYKKMFEAYAISPLDGRYFKNISFISEYFSG